MKTLEEIKKEIRTINPAFTDELLDLLYEYVFAKHYKDIVDSLSKNKDMIDKVIFQSLSNNKS